MDDLISRQAAISELRKCQTYLLYDGDDEPNIERSSAEAVIMHLPSAQPEIIACGDCKHWICHDRRCGYWNHGVKPLDWCCHAERRTDE